MPLHHNGSEPLSKKTRYDKGSSSSSSNSRQYSAPTEDELLEEEENLALENNQLANEEYEALCNDTLVTSSVKENYLQRWKRPSFVPFQADEKSLLIQWLDIDQTQGQPLPYHPSGDSNKEVPGARQGTVPVIQFYGVTDPGQSILVHVHGFTPYLYAQCTERFLDHTSAIRQALNIQLKNRIKGPERNTTNDVVLGIQVIKDRSSILGYRKEGQKSYFLKIFVGMPGYVPTCRTILDNGFDIPNVGLFSSSLTYESNVPFPLRFLIDKDISGSNWIELPTGTYKIRSEKEKVSYCQLEVDIVHEDIISHPAEGDYSKIGKIRILSFDIECKGRKGHFPEAEHDPVIQIANMITVQGDTEPTVKNVFTLGGCLPIVGSQVINSDTEEEMLTKWSQFIRDTDPDIITGYNIANFDIPYLMNRAKALQNRHPTLKRFGELGRLKKVLCTMKDTTFQSSAYGKRENVETTIHGRVIFDMLPYMYRNHKLSSYSLNSVSAHFLNQQKEDVHHSVISDLQNGTDEDRRRLAVYCLKDAYLPWKLMDVLFVLINYIEMARVTGVSLSYLLLRGQQIKVFSMLLRKCGKSNLLIPNLPKRGSTDGVAYEGATVIEPKKAYYDVPIATLDFASLYPSIMQAYNLCYSTLLTKTEAQTMDKDAYQQTPTGEFFVKTTTKKGILPLILDELLAARKRAKRDMKLAKDPMVKAVQNGRQLALKISANSVYGFTGATVGQLPCLAIASSVTGYGRNLLHETKAYVESNFTIDKGYPANAEVVYGDTDSVMVKFGYKTVKDCMPIAEQAADAVTEIFPRPIKLEFEKVYFPFLLMNKKRYAGLYWTNPDKYDKMDTKGLETVRRDNCLLVRRVVETCLRKILIDRNIEDAISYCKNIISDLLQNKMDISLLVITKALGRSADDTAYAGKQAHVELAMRMKKRDAGSAPQVGDRVAYVIIQKEKGAPAFEKSEDPVYVLENNLPIDTEYYLTNQLSGPLTRLFEPIISNPQSLLTGSHTLNISRPTPTAQKGGIMMFAVKKTKCLNCKAAISEKEKTLCKHCRPYEAEFYQSKVEELQENEKVFGKLWTCCQRCQGSLHQDILCSNRDCPIFYKRKKVQKDLKEVQDLVDKFSF